MPAFAAMGILARKPPDSLSSPMLRFGPSDVCGALSTRAGGVINDKLLLGFERVSGSRSRGVSFATSLAVVSREGGGSTVSTHGVRAVARLDVEAAGAGGA